MTQSQQSFRYVLLDTNILQFLQREKGSLASELLLFVENLLDEPYTLAISDYCIFELLAGSSKTKEKKLLETFKTFKRFGGRV